MVRDDSEVITTSRKYIPLHRIPLYLVIFHWNSLEFTVFHYMGKSAAAKHIAPLDAHDARLASLSLSLVMCLVFMPCEHCSMDGVGMGSWMHGCTGVDSTDGRTGWLDGWMDD